MSVGIQPRIPSGTPSARGRSGLSGAGSRRIWLAAALLGALCALPAASQAPEPKADLMQLGLEDLMNIEVTSVSRRGQKISETASAVYVITQEDIRRSGATSIPEALRMAPGLHVARLDANKWAISIRGFTSRFADKLLVMIDGRSVYTPVFSGVYWETQDTLLEDIERIEVVRGPGAVMWGSNAVNGVVNIITKRASETLGVSITGGGGNEAGGFGGIRYGARAGPKVNYRLFSKYFGRSSLLSESGERATDDWQMLRGGFRLDWEGSDADSLTLSGETYEGDAGGRVSFPSSRFPFQQQDDETAAMEGSHVLGRWTHRVSDRSQTSFQVYFDDYERSEKALERQSVKTLDFDFHHQMELSSRNHLSWGMGYRVHRDEFINTPIATFDPDHRTLQLFNTFVQSEVGLVEDQLILTFGSKFEHNSFTDWEVQPGASLLWDRSTRDSVWFSVSRAVRIPSRQSHDVRANLLGFPGLDGRMNLVAILGDSSLQSEELLAYDAGYRLRVNRRLSVDLAGFYNDYENLQTVTLGRPFVDTSLPGEPLVLPFLQNNNRLGKTYGLEAFGTLKAAERWKVHFGYSWLRMRLRDLSGTSSDGSLNGGLTPTHQAHARSFLDLPGGLEWDAAYYVVDTVQSSGVPRYHRVDTRIGWRASRWLEISATLQGLLDNQHPEMPPSNFEERTEIGRSAYARVTWRF